MTTITSCLLNWHHILGQIPNFYRKFVLQASLRRKSDLGTKVGKNNAQRLWREVFSSASWQRVGRSTSWSRLVCGPASPPGELVAPLKMTWLGLGAQAMVVRLKGRQLHTGGPKTTWVLGSKNVWKCLWSVLKLTSNNIIILILLLVTINWCRSYVFCCISYL